MQWLQNERVSTLTRRMMSERPPGPGWRAAMNVLEGLRRDPRVFVQEMTGRYGDVVHFRIGHQNLLIFIHPDDIEEILLTKAKSFHKDRVTGLLRVGLGDGLLTSEGAHWKRQRRMVSPSMRKRQIASYAQAMVARAEAFAQTLGDDQQRDIHHDMMILTLEIVTDTLFGADIGADAHQVGQSLEIMLESFLHYTRTWRRLLPPWEVLLNHPVLGMGRGLEARDALDKVIYRLIDERRAQPDAGRQDLVSLLLAVRDEDGSQMSNLQLRDESLTMFMAGHETTALALSYALWLLAEHPEAMARLQQEIDEVLKGRSATFDDLKSLTWAHAVVRESMRLVPPAWAVGREAIEDVEIGGYLMPSKWQALIPIWNVHRDPRWFDKPQDFAPQRWLEPKAQELPRFAYFPFGGGPRTCIGNHFAIMEAVLVLVTLCQRANFAQAEGHSLELHPSVTLRPVGGVVMDVSRRA